MSRIRIKRIPSEMSSLLDILRSAGQNAPSVEDKCQVIELFRRQSPELGQQVDRLLIEDTQQLRSGLAEAQVNLHRLKEMLDKATAPPWHAGIFLRPLDAANCPRSRVLVCHAGARRVVGLADGLEAGSFLCGDGVFLNQELTAIVAKAHQQPAEVGETAVFLRSMPDGRRLIVRHRDEEIVVDVAGSLGDAEFREGECLRVDRSAWIAYEKMPQADGRRYLLEEVSGVGSDHVGGQRGNLAALLDALTTTLVEPDKARRYGLSPRRSILMIGPPGCGKTLMARVAAAEIARQSGRKCRFAVVKPAEWEDPYVGVTQQNIRNCFRALREAAQESMAVLFMDEIECAGRIRGSAVGHHSDKFLAALLAELDGFSDRDGVAVICATNRKDLVDPALLERISDLEIQVQRPDMRGAREIFGVHLPTSLPYSPNGELAMETRQELIDRAVARLYAPNADNQIGTLKFRDGKTRSISARELISGRCIAQICRAAGQRAFMRDVASGQAGIRQTDMDEAVAAAIDRMTTTLTPHNARVYLTDLPQDLDVVAVDAPGSALRGSHNYLNVT